MKLNNILLKSVVAIGIAATLFACEGKKAEVKKLNLKDDAPVAVGEQINLKYTDSGKLAANLITPQLLDYSNFNFPYREFPKGINLYFYEKNKKTIIQADYAIRFEKTNLVDLRNNVKIITADSIVLTAKQIYWDQKNNWVFTDQEYTITFSDGSFNQGSGFDSSEDFTTFLSRKNQGIQFIDKKEISNEY